MANFRQRINDFIKMTEDKKHNVSETIAFGNKLIEDITSAWRNVHTNRDQVVYEKLGTEVARYLDSYESLTKDMRKNPRETEFQDLKLLMAEDIDKMRLDIKLGKRQLIHINLSKLTMDHKLFPRLSHIVPRDGDYGIFESSGNVVKFSGNIDPRKVNVVRDRYPNPRVIIPVTKRTGKIGYYGIYDTKTDELLSSFFHKPVTDKVGIKAEAQRIADHFKTKVRVRRL